MINSLTRGLVSTARQSLYRWRQRGGDLTSTITSSSAFGENSCFNHFGDTVAVYTPLRRYQTNPLQFTGSVIVYRWDGKNFTQLGQELMQGDRENYFGRRISLSGNGNRIAIQMSGGFGVGFPLNRAYLYDYNGSQWDLIAEFGNAETVALSHDGNRVATSYAVYEFNGADWIGILLSNSENIAFSKNGNRIASDTGSIFTLQNGNWGLTTNLNTPASNVYQNGPQLNEDGTLFASCSATEVKAFKENGSGIWAQQGAAFTFNPLESISCALSATGRLMIRNQVLNAPENTWQIKIYEFAGSAWTQIGATKTFYNGRYQSPPKISGDGKTLGVPSTVFPNIRNGAVVSYSVHRKELD